MKIMLYYMVEVDIYERVMIWQYMTIVVVTWCSSVVPNQSTISKIRGVAFRTEWKMLECMGGEWKLYWEGILEAESKCKLVVRETIQIHLVAAYDEY